MMSHRLILASASPRRQQLLREAGYGFTIEPADIDERAVPPGLSTDEVAEYLAVEKARVVAVRTKDADAVVLAADTVVSLDGRQLGKPQDADDAYNMLSSLSGTIHRVITGVCVRRREEQWVRRATSTVQMRKLSDDEVVAYVAGRQWEGKAGGYGIQDEDPFVINMGGSLTNIVGLPMEETIELLTAADVQRAISSGPLASS